jgi:hypothetical protein
MWEECFQFDSTKHTSSCSKIRDYPYWTSRKNSLELIELSSINKVSLFVCLHGDKTYNSFVCYYYYYFVCYYYYYYILLALMKIRAYGSKALQ